MSARGDLLLAVLDWVLDEQVHDNGKPPSLPDGWWPADATSAMDPRNRSPHADP